MTSEQPAAGPWSAGPPSPAVSTDWRLHSGAVPERPLVEPLPASIAARVLLVALIGGFSAQYLFVGQRPGINLLLWVAIVLGASWLLRRPEARMERGDAWLPVAALAFAAFVWLRDEAALRAFDVPAAAALTLASAVALGGTAVTRRGLAALGHLGAKAVGLGLVGAIGLAPAVRPLGSRLARDSAALRVLRGLLVALPLLVIFVGLFSAADSVFAAHLRSAFGFELDVRDALYRLLFAGAAAWLLAGTVVAAWQVREAGLVAGPGDGPATAIGRRALGVIEGVVVLVALDLLFALFVLVQGAYLFGGLDTLEVSGLTYSEYARRGFFELMAVGLLAGGVLLVIDRLIARRGWAYRAAAGGLAGLSGFVLVSAVVRLGLYQQAYGWTELRLFALAAILWLGLGIAATAFGLLTDRAQRVPRLLIGLALAVAVLVNLLGPQSFVASQNLQRVIDPSLVPPDGRSGVDFHYIDSLGYDAVPAVVEALPRLTGEPRTHAERFLRRRAAELAREAPALGWQSWNLARTNAIEALLRAGYLVPGT